MVTWSQLLDFVLKRKGHRRCRGSWRSRSYKVSEARYQSNTQPDDMFRVLDSFRFQRIYSPDRK